MKAILSNEGDIKSYADSVLATLSKKTTDTATILGLSGNLGSGKTTFTQAVAKNLGVEETVQSPTFVIMKIFNINKNEKWEHLIHIDAYRLENPEELLTLGWDDIILNAKNLVLIEWPEKVKKLMPKNSHYIYFNFLNETDRGVEFKQN